MLQNNIDYENMTLSQLQEESSKNTNKIRDVFTKIKIKNNSWQEHESVKQKREELIKPLSQKGYILRNLINEKMRQK